MAHIRYIHQRANGVYYLRIRLPRALAQAAQTREIKRSLKTRDPGVAAHRAQPLIAAIRAHRKSADTMDIKDLIKRIQSGDITIREWKAKGINIAPTGEIRLDDVEVDPENPDDHRSFQQILSMLPSLISADHPNSAPTAQPGNAAPTSTPLSTIVDEYVSEMESTGAWTAKSQRENAAIYALAIRILGNPLSSAIDHATARHLKTEMRQLPPNVNKNPKFRNKSLDEVKTLNTGGRTLSTTTVNKYLIRMASLGDWMTRHGYLSNNPFHGLTLKTKKGATKDERRAFTFDDLTQIFSHPIFTGQQSAFHSYYYWLPLIALHTGMRVSEVSQLYIDDIAQEEHIWVFRITERPDTHLKTPAAKRIIPVHHKLIDLGLIDAYIKHLTEKGETRLWPSLERGRDGYGHYSSKWHARFLKNQIVLSDPEKKSFHSYRHTFIDRLQKKEVEERHVAALAGHEVGQSESYSRYGKGFSVKALQSVIEKLDLSQELASVVPFQSTPKPTHGYP